MKRSLSIVVATAMVLGTVALFPAKANAEEEFPTHFDLRDRGVVTPVKFQNPYGSCWSFAGIAAAESSILTTLGMTTDEYKAATGHDFDLSEKHLAWFGALPITSSTNASQAGEGIYVVNDPLDNSHYDAGGEGIMITNLFSSGVGPVNEDAFPYQGNEGLTHADAVKNDPDSTKAYLRKKYEKKLNMTFDEAVIKLQTEPDKANEWFKALYDGNYLTVPGNELTVDMIVDAYYQKELDDVNSRNYTWYSPVDDWTIPELGEDGHPNRDVYSGYTLLHGNQLPALFNKDDEGKWSGINQAGMDAVKSELMKGHAVEVQFCADDALPDQQASEKGYMRVDTWAHYTYEDTAASHGVCIVGWDDDYSIDNFNQGTDSEGNSKTPPADGAWIVKNSWGSETEPKVTEDGQIIGGKAWGVVDENGKHTGYFYMSYYDKSVCDAETMEFDVDLYNANGNMSTWMYDYMPGRFTLMKYQDANVIKTANVFPNSSGVNQSLYAVATRTSNPNATVKYSLYLLNDSAKNPEDGILLGETTATYTYSGFHREKLDGSIVLKDGETLAIVVQETVSDGKGGVLYDLLPNQMRTESWAKEVGETMYGKSVVHEGESFVYSNGTWTDLTKYKHPMTDEAEKAMGKPVSELLATDNFCIKAYMVADSVAMHRLYNPNSGEHFYTADAAEKDNVVNAGWTYEGVAWTAPLFSDTPVYRLYNPNSGEHFYTTKETEKDSLTPLGWRDEGIGWYSANEADIPVYRLYNPNAAGAFEAGAHFYTMKEDERDILDALGWNYEGIGWYGE